MNKIIITILISLFTVQLQAQDTTSRVLSKEEAAAVMKQIKPTLEKDTYKFMKKGCDCVDSITISGKSRETLTKEISDCIHKEALSYQLSRKMLSTMLEPGNNKITLETNTESQEYKKYYYEIERMLNDSCEAFKFKIALDNRESSHSLSTNKEAMKFYEMGSLKITEGDYAAAILSFERALSIDPKFAFCWDNLGICNRMTGNYQEALKAYRKSLEVDPNGRTPLQNIPVVYEFQKDHPSALKAYKELIARYKNDPEGYYGAGRIYILSEDYENGLDYLCKAYNLYAESGSPYRTDAENLISSLYASMKAKGKEKKFNDILKRNHINQE